jgi:hypothetical protein
LETLVFAHRVLGSFGLVLLAAACGDSLAPRRDVEAGPHFVRWAPGAQPRFSSVGAAPSATGGADDLALSLVTAVPAVVDGSSSAATSGSILSWSHSVGSGGNRLLLVGVSISNASRRVLSVTLDGTPLSFLGAQNNSDGAVRAEMWYLNAPLAGTRSVKVTMSGSADAVAGAMSFSGVDPVAPLRGFATAGGAASSTNPAVAASSAPEEIVVAVAALQGTAGTVTPGPGQTGRYARTTGSDADEVIGVSSTALGAPDRVMSWTKTAGARWAVAAAVVKPHVTTSLSLGAYKASFWAVRGESRRLQINYSSGGGTQPFLRLTIADPTSAPGLGELAKGDSVLVTATVDPDDLAVDLQPTGLTFGAPAQLELWYGGASGDLNEDGVVDGADAAIEQQLLGMWYQEGAASPWTAIAATKSLAEKRLSAGLQHFSGYAVSW